MPVYTKIKKIVAVWLLCVIALLQVHSVEAASNKHRSVKDLAYGVALYDYFQQDYFNALSELMVAEKTDRIKHHAEFAKVFRAGIHLSYGMDEEAGKLFHEIIDADQSVQSDSTDSRTLLGANKRASQENIARAWFYLGKLLYKKGEYRAAGDKLVKTSRHLSRSLHPEYAFLLDSVNKRLAFSESEKLSGFDPEVSRSSSWSYYSEYNDLLVSLSQIESSSQSDVEIVINEKLAIATSLDELAARVGESTALDESEELLSLKDKIHITAGFLQLQLEKDRRAIKSFKRVRSESVLAGQALLGYGWAAANAGDYRQALRPWQVLATRSMLEQSTHEALLALPFVYEKMEAHSSALEGYDRAATVLQLELQLLAKLRQDLQAVEPQMLSKYYDRTSVKWLDDINSASLMEKKQFFSTELLKDRLSALVTRNHFSLLEKQRQDVEWLRQKLARWALDVDAMRFVLQAQQQRSSEAVSPKAREKLLAEVSQLQQQRDMLAARMQGAIHNGAINNKESNAFKRLSTADELKQWQRIEAAEQKIQSIEAVLQQHDISGESVTAIDLDNYALQKKQLEWARGLLNWQIAQSQVHRSWQLKKLMAAIDKHLETLRNEAGGLEQLAEENRRKAEEQQRLVDLQQRVTTQSEEANALALQLDKTIVNILLEDVERLQQQTTIYLAQARLARARMLDNLNEEDFDPVEGESETVPETDVEGNNQSEQTTGISLQLPAQHQRLAYSGGAE